MAVAKIDPLRHYLLFGCSEGREMCDEGRRISVISERQSMLKGI